MGKQFKKEVKISLAILGGLLLVFGVVVYRRVTRPAEQIGPAASVAPTVAGAPKLMNSLEKPTMLTAQAESGRAPELLATNNSRWSKPAPRTDNETRLASAISEPRTSFMPAAAPANAAQPDRTFASDDAAPTDDAGGFSRGPTGATGSASAVGGPSLAGQTPDPFRNHSDRHVEVIEADSVRPGTAQLAEAQLADAGSTSTSAPDSVQVQAMTNAVDGDSWRRPAPLDAGSPHNDAQVARKPIDDGMQRAAESAPPRYMPAAPAPNNTWSNDPPAASAYSARPGADAARSPAADYVPRKDGKYIVQPNDNYWVISQRVYGTGAYFKALHEFNRKQHPQANTLKVGDELAAPDVAVLQKAYPDLCPKPRKEQVAGGLPRNSTVSARMQATGKVYVVQEGDTLFDIARRELGKPSRWAEIYDLNREMLGEDFDYLRTGTQLLMPADGDRPDSVTRHPGGSLQR